MSRYTTPFTLGNLVLENNIFYAPLAGCSDFPFRKMSKRYRPGLIFCEMVKMDALVRFDQNTFRLLDYERQMHPIGAQICGSKVSLAAQSAKIIEDLGFDVIDLNCGCPVDKVTKDNSGSGLLKFPKLIGDILSEMVQAVNIPVTLKIRIGWDENSINAPLITSIAEKAGACAIFVHGRTRAQAYRGFGNRDVIRECKKQAKSIVVFGNGDIMDPKQAEHMFTHTNCDGILISRGCMGAPWLIQDIIHYLSKNPLERRADFIQKELLLHFAYILQYREERKALLDMRRVGCYYLKNCVNVKRLRGLLNKAESTKEAVDLVKNFDFLQSGA